MNPTSIQEAKKLFLSLRGKTKSSKKVNVIICPPSLYLNELIRLHTSRKNIKFGLQNAFWKNEGSFTGEISPKMAKNSGVEYIIVGHSERRALGETNEMVREKIHTTLENKLKPIICVGEGSRDDHGRYLSFLRSQIEEGLKGVLIKDLKNIIIAYEPIWAIGKSDKDAVTAHNLEEMILYIKKILKEIYNDNKALKTKVIYGGSVEGGNAKNLLEETNIDGFLVGHASLKKDDFVRIYNLF